MAKAAYIHIPFCAHKCDFCDFAAFAGLDHLADDYGKVVCDEIENRELSKKENLHSLFYGGGTPGYVHPSVIEKIQNTLLQKTGVSENAEITLETTPASITKEKAKAWQAMGINRLSIGIESLHDNELKAMGRDHNSQEALRGIDAAVESGFTNISLDFMYGLPEQTMKSWQETLQKALSFGTPHISAYGLTIANNSPLLSRYPRDSKSYPDEDGFVSMYQLLVEMAAAAGLAQYEISNFAKDGFKSRHNMIYWQNEEYLAYGVSAHRYVDSVRSSNYRSLNKYMQNPLSNETEEHIDALSKAKEGLFLGLRMVSGISVQEFKERYDLELDKIFADKLADFNTAGLVELKDGRIKLSQKGQLISNSILSELLITDEIINSFKN